MIISNKKINRKKILTYAIILKADSVTVPFFTLILIRAHTEKITDEVLVPFSWLGKGKANLFKTCMQDHNNYLKLIQRIPMVGLSMTTLNATYNYADDDSNFEPVTLMQLIK